ALMQDIAFIRDLAPLPHAQQLRHVRQLQETIHAAHSWPGRFSGKRNFTGDSNASAKIREHQRSKEVAFRKLLGPFSDEDRLRHRLRCHRLPLSSISLDAMAGSRR